MGTVDSIKTLVKVRFADIDDTSFQTFFDDSYRKLIARSQVRNTTSVISLVAGQREYSLDSSIIKIYEAYYQASSDPSTWVQLQERSIDEFAAKRRGWRQNDSQSSPISEYYTSSTVSGDSGVATIGFVPLPDSATSGGYPNVTLYVSAYAELSASETTPSQLLGDEYFVYEICRRWAALRQSPRAAEDFRLLAERELELNVQHIKNLQAQGTDFQIVSPTRSTSQVI